MRVHHLLCLYTQKQLLEAVKLICLTQLFCPGVSGNIVPATYKQKRSAIAAPKGAEGDDEKAAAAAAPAEEAAAEATPGMGRGNR